MAVIRQAKIKTKCILTFALLFSLLYRFFVDYLHVFSACRYLIDLSLFILVVMTYRHRKKMNRTQKELYRFVLVYYVYCLVTYFFNFQSPVFFVYGSIYQFRYYVFAMLCLIWYQKKDVEKISSYIDVLFYINAMITFYQYFVKGIIGDYLGGLFGSVQGCNAYSNMLLIVVLTISGMKYLEKKEKTIVFGLKLAICFAIAAFAELKFFFVEFLILIIFAVFFTGFSWKKFALSIVAFIALVGGFTVFTNTYSYGKDFLNINVWIQLATSGGYSGGYGGIGEVNRLTFASVIVQRFLNTPLKMLFGLGLGNCSYSSISIFNTPFYEMNYSSRYEWFTSSHTLLEQGWVGFAFYIMFFILFFVKAVRELKKQGADRAACYTAEIMAVMGFVLMIYNNSLTMESGFLFYFAAMLPFIKSSRIDDKGVAKWKI